MKTTKNNPETISLGKATFAANDQALTGQSVRLPVSQRFRLACSKCKTITNARRLWDFADNQNRADWFFAVLLELCPWAFNDPTNANSIKPLAVDCLICRKPTTVTICQPCRELACSQCGESLTDGDCYECRTRYASIDRANAAV